MAIKNAGLSQPGSIVERGENPRSSGPAGGAPRPSTVRGHPECGGRQFDVVPVAERGEQIGEVPIQPARQRGEPLRAGHVHSDGRHIRPHLCCWRSLLSVTAAASVRRRASSIATHVFADMRGPPWGLGPIPHVCSMFNRLNMHVHVAADRFVSIDAHNA